MNFAIDEADTDTQAALAVGAEDESLTVDAAQDRWQTAVVAIGRRALATSDANLLIGDAAALLADALDLDFSGVAIADGKGALSVQLTPARPGVRTPAGSHHVSDRADESLVGLALAEGQPVAVTDLPRDDRCRDALLRRSQAHSAVACPLKMGRQTYGALLVAHLTPRQFTQHDLMCVETVGHLITTTIARNRAEHALTEQLRFDAALLNTVEDVVVALDADTRILNINRACELLVGFSLPEIRQRRLCGVFIAPEDASNVHAAFSRLDTESAPAHFECMVLTKHGGRRRIAWAFTRVPGSQSDSLALMGAGVDITEKWEMENRMQRAGAARAAEPRPDDSGQNGGAESRPAVDGAPRVEPKADAPPVDRRTRPRRAYPYMQRMAAILNGQMPLLSEFREVECNDIGAGGFSYFAPTRPTETDVVVAFGSGATQTYLTARLVHVTATMHHGVRMYLVGCRYTGRHTYTR